MAAYRQETMKQLFIRAQIWIPQSRIVRTSHKTWWASEFVSNSMHEICARRRAALTKHVTVGAIRVSQPK